MWKTFLLISKPQGTQWFMERSLHTRHTRNGLQRGDTAGSRSAARFPGHSLVRATHVHLRAPALEVWKVLLQVLHTHLSLIQITPQSKRATEIILDSLFFWVQKWEQLGWKVGNSSAPSPEQEGEKHGRVGRAAGGKHWGGGGWEEWETRHWAK